MIQSKINLLNIEKKTVKFVFLNKLKFIVITINFNDYYLELKNEIILSKNSVQRLNFVTHQQIFFLTSFLNSFGLLSTKILHLKGLGLKANISKINRTIFLKLGFSHIIRVKYDAEILVNIKNNFIFIQSINKNKIGNLAAFIRSLKYPDSYKGKGVWYKNEIKKLKTVKKK
jgi:large subunit ribosomal protein L6